MSNQPHNNLPNNLMSDRGENLPRALLSEDVDQARPGVYRGDLKGVVEAQLLKLKMDNLSKK